jgi:threonylcarbamoyladenosine tRNA methylthiotransferase MtaB
MRVAFKTIGCRLNQAETAQMAADFLAAGARRVKFEDAADVYVVHTCAITANAEHTCIRTARAAKRREPGAFVVLAGCAAELRPDALLRESQADLVLGQAAKRQIVDRIKTLRPEMWSQPNPVPVCPPSPAFDTTRALVKIQDGCDFRCAYCVVPDARGVPTSRPLQQVLVEVKQLIDAGYREITLTGANLGCYRDGARNLLHLLEAVAGVDALERMRISSIESTTVERDVIDFMADCPKLCRYVHLPLQSGDDRILKLMGRRYSVRMFREVVEYAVARIPYMGLGTDIIVGFPGEDVAAYRNTLDLIDRLPFNNLHVFPYSGRPGTPAATWPDQVPASEKKKRAAELIALGEQKRAVFGQSFVGRSVSTLIERLGADGAGMGWTGEYMPARITSRENAVNDIVVFSPEAYSDAALQG